MDEERLVDHKAFHLVMDSGRKGSGEQLGLLLVGLSFDPNKNYGQKNRLFLEQVFFFFFFFQSIYIYFLNNFQPARYRVFDFGNLT